MTFEILAKLVADDFKRTMDDNGFHTFSEMKKCFMWDANDIKEEVSTIVSEISNKALEDTHNASNTAFVADDGSFVQIGIFDEMSWGKFKKLVFSYIK